MICGILYCLMKTADLEYKDKAPRGNHNLSKKHSGAATEHTSKNKITKMSGTINNESYINNTDTSHECVCKFVVDPLSWLPA